MERALLLLLVLVPIFAATPVEDNFQLHIVHLNDFHARFDPINSGAGSCSPGAPCFGGIARVVSKAKELIGGAPGGNYLLLNAGDNFQGTLYYTFYKWNITSIFINMIPFDAMTLGNHEFDDGIAGLVPFIQAARFPTLVANMNSSYEPSMQGIFQKSTVVERGGKRIGIIGYVLKGYPGLANTGELIFLDEAESVSAEASRLKRDGVDIIIALSHAGLDVDREVAAKVEHVDVIVGGHSHTLLFTGTPPDGDTAQDVYPVMVTQKSGRKVAIVQAFAFTKYLGHLVATFDKTGELINATGNPVILDETVAQDEVVLAALVPWREGLAEVANQKIGETKVNLDASGKVCYSGECNIGNFIADAMVREMVSLEPFSTTAWTKAAIGIMNAEGIRASIFHTNNRTITYNDLVTVMPFQDTIDLIEIRGSTLRAALEYSVQGSSPNKFYSQHFLQHSGLRVTFDIRRPSGARLVSVSALCRQCSVPRFEPLEEDRWYSVATDSYLASGGSGFHMLSNEARNRTTGRLDIDVVMDYLRHQSPVIHGLEGRTVVITGESP